MIAWIDRDYVVIIPDTEIGDQATVRIENAQENRAFVESREYVETLYNRHLMTNSLTPSREIEQIATH